jgi:hypothetical protein
MNKEIKIKLLKKIFNINELEINNIINSVISLDELFKIHYIKTNIEYFILSLPKTGTNTIMDYVGIIKEKDIIFTHSIIEYTVIDKRFINYTIKEIIEYISSKTSYEKLYVIFPYREPESRYISRYLWEVKCKNLKNLLNDVEIINDEKFNEIKYNADIDYIIVNESLNDFNLNLSNYTYDNKNGYSIIPYNNKINFIFTLTIDINKMLNNFFDLNIETINIINKNEINNKKIILKKSIKDYLYHYEKELLTFYNLYKCYKNNLEYNEDNYKNKNLELLIEKLL